MNKIINGKRYNTETAELIASADNGYGKNDFEYTYEELYKKRTGEYFLYGKGGGLTSYAERVPGGGGALMGGEKIIPLTREEAAQWAENHMDADDYEKEFEVKEEGNTVYSILLPNSLHKEIKEEAEKRGVPMKDIVIERLQK